MNKRTMIIMMLGGVSLLPVSAQNGWFVEAGGGVQTFFSSDASKLSFGKRLTPSYSLGVGKWITPTYALRMQVGGYALNGLSTADGLYLRDPLDDGMIYGKHDPVTDHVTVEADGSYRYYLRYLNVHADFMVSFAQLLWNRQGRFDVVPAVGLGYARGFSYRGSAATNSLTANVSVAAKYRVMKCLDINLEIGSALMPDHFDGRITGRKYEPTLGATVGLTYRFKSDSPKQKREKRQRKNRQAVADTVYLVQKIIERPIYKDRIVEKVVEKKQEPFRIASIGFGYASAKPLKNQEMTFANIVDYLNRNPSVHIRLDGYADKATGSGRTNLMLSIRRTDHIRNVLIKKYGIAPSRIEAQAIGSSVQPYDTKELNRVVIVYVLP